jgi:protein-disulfide isomerase
MNRSLAFVALTALALGACSKKPADTSGGVTAPSTPIAAVPPPAGKQWTDVVAATPDGGFRMGNPNAAVKLVEYASFTCPHCKHFAETGTDQLKSKYVSTGKVSWEFRPVMIHPMDAPITMVMMCRGPEPFFALTEQIYAAQDAILNKFIALPAAEQQRIAGLPIVDNYKAQMQAGDLYGFFGARGMPRAQADACLSDQRRIDQLTAWVSKAQEAGVNSTPTFAINGSIWEANGTGDLWPQLDAALAQTVG